MAKAVFLDRDGTIVEDTGYLHEISKVRFLPRASLAIKLLRENGFKVIIITNQAGVARGYFTEERVQEINSYIQARLAEQGAPIDMIYYCPHHIEGVVEEYRQECYSRKPNPGMIEQAVRELGIDLAGSFVIGDKPSDIEAGHRAGCLSILLADGVPADRDQEIKVISDHTAPDLYEAVQWLLQYGHPRDRH